MITRLTAAQHERQELLIEQAADLATLVQIVRDEGRNLTADQRGALEFLLRATRLVRERFEPVSVALPLITEACA